jgi:hypothetical protein
MNLSFKLARSLRLIAVARPVMASSLAAKPSRKRLRRVSEAGDENTPQPAAPESTGKDGAGAADREADKKPKAKKGAKSAKSSLPKEPTGIKYDCTSMRPSKLASSDKWMTVMSWNVAGTRPSAVFEKHAGHLV